MYNHNANTPTTTSNINFCLPSHTEIETNERLLARPEAISWVKTFFIRRDLQVARQKALQLGDERKVDTIDEQLDDAEDAEDAAKSAYDTAVRKATSGAVNNLSLDAVTVSSTSTAGTSSGSNEQKTATDEQPAAAATAATTTQQNAYGDLGAATSSNADADDDFI